MPDFYDTFPKGFFDQENNLGGGDFQQIWSMRDYSPGYYTFEGKPITAGLRFKFTNDEELLLLSVDKKLTSSSKEEDRFPAKGVTFTRHQGKLYHEDGSEGRQYILRSDSFDRIPEGIAHVKLKSNVRKGVKQGSFVMTPDQIVKEINEHQFILSPSLYGSVMVEEISPYEWKLFISVNDVYPNYNDLVLNMTSANSPLANFVTVI